MAYHDKEQERWHLDYFLRARRSATGEELTLVSPSESPDFICRRPSGELVGVEHTRIMYDPERADILEACGLWDPECDEWEVISEACLALAKKEAKRLKDHWKLPDRTILVLDLVDRVLLERWPDEDGGLSNELGETGFLEVWISDHSSIDGFGEVTAIGLFPKPIWGVQGQGYLGGVPYK